MLMKYCRTWKHLRDRFQSNNNVWFYYFYCCDAMLLKTTKYWRQLMCALFEVEVRLTITKTCFCFLKRFWKNQSNQKSDKDWEWINTNENVNFRRFWRILNLSFSFYETNLRENIPNTWSEVKSFWKSWLWAVIFIDLQLIQIKKHNHLKDVALSNWTQKQNNFKLI